MLRHYIGPYRDDWDLYLPVCEFAVNNSYNASIHTTPFKLTYGHNPLTPLSAPLQSHLPTALKYIQNYSDRLAAAKSALQAAQQRQKTYADKSRRPIDWKVGDQMVLTTKNIKFKGEKSVSSHKLLPRYVGPFPITRLIAYNKTLPATADNISAIQLQLPPTMSIHNVFHPSMLKPYNVHTHVAPGPVLFESDGTPVYEVQTLMAHRSHMKGGAEHAE